MIKKLTLTASILVFSVSATHAVKQQYDSEQAMRTHSASSPQNLDMHLYRTVIEAAKAEERASIKATYKRKAAADKRKSVEKMLTDGLPPEKIEFFTGIKAKKIKRIKKEMDATYKKSQVPETGSSSD